MAYIERQANLENEGFKTNIYLAGLDTFTHKLRKGAKNGSFVV